MLTAPHPRRHVPGGSNHTMADRGAAARVLYARLHMHTLGAGGEIRVRHTALASVTTGLYRRHNLAIGVFRCHPTSVTLTMVHWC